MNIVRLMIVMIFLGLAACGGGSDVTPLATAPGTPAAKSRIASHGIIFTGMPEATKDVLTGAASASHAGMIRMDLAWTSVQPSAPPVPYDWQWVDASVRSARKNNLEILALIQETPTWASSNPTHPAARSFPPTAEHWTTWAAFITAFVDRYGAKGTNEIRHWEIWGEANDTGQWLGTPAEYAHLYSVAYDAIKASDPAAQVLMAGLNESQMPGWLDAVLNDPEFPAKNKIDIIDVHIRGTVAHVKEFALGWPQAFQLLGGVVNKPVWVTEFGFPSNPTYQAVFDRDFVGTSPADGEQKQAAYYNIVIPWLLTDGKVEKVFVTLRDLDAPNTPWESEGIITHAAAPKPAFEAVKLLSDRF